MPSWLRGDVLDVRKVVSVWAAMNRASDNQQINTKVRPELVLFNDCHLALSAVSTELPLSVAEDNTAATRAQTWPVSRKITLWD